MLAALKMVIADHDDVIGEIEEYTFRRGRPRSGVVLKSLLAFYGDVK